ncbi:MAG: hemerythrin domain-containing protein [Geodermatophilaceae bacterium]
MATGISDDTIMMYVIHDALRRDLEHLTRAVESGDLADPQRRQAANAGWELFKYQLHHHHTGEDVALWPRVRPRLAGRPDDLALLDEMEAEHVRIGPLITEIDAAVADQDTGVDRLPEATAAFRRQLTDHLGHEEREAVPVIESVMTRKDWKEFSPYSAEVGGGIKGAAEFFPYILTGADPERGAQARQHLPAATEATDPQGVAAPLRQAKAVGLIRPA